MGRFVAIPLCAAAIFIAGLQTAVAAQYAILPVANPEYRANSVFGPPENLNAPRFAGLVERYGLQAVLRGETDEFRRILLLRHWLHERLVVDKTRPAPSWDALAILEAGPAGGQFSCAQFEVAQDAVLNAMGYVTRGLHSGPDGEDPRLTGQHGSNEVWCNSLSRWVLVDAELDSHFEKDGRPLSALDVRQAYLTDGAAGVVRVEGPERKPVPRGKYDQWGLTPKAYACIGWVLQTDRFSIWPESGSSVEVVYDDQFFRSHTWFRNGDRHWAYDAGCFLRVADRGAIEWTPNVLKVKASVEADSVRVRIDSMTPNLKEYQIKSAAGDWEPVETSFRLGLSQPRHEWRLRALNLAGVAGPEYSLVVVRK